jgi:hypothetical protein
MMQREGMDETALKQLFNGIRGIVILDTLGDIAGLKSKIEKLDTGLLVLETRTIGCDNVENVIREAIERNEKRGKNATANS